ncbi:MAG: glycoside hydrolase family 97 protein [Bacteroidales bacterium]|nr:glycoside hydrolase family 97 protein [Bacteroidales bacterium]
MKRHFQFAKSKKDGSECIHSPQPSGKRIIRLKNRSIAVLFILFSICLDPLYASENLKLSSPNSEISLEVTLLEKIYYTVFFKDDRVLEASPMSLSIGDKALGATPKLLKSVIKGVDQSFNTIWGSRREIKDQYNQLTLDFEGGFSVEFRAYNSGVAYRFVTRLNEEQVVVNNEEVSFRFNFGVDTWLMEEKSYEANYGKTRLDVQEMTNFNNTRNKIYLPIVVQSTPNVKVLITEAGLYDYPSLFLDRGNDYENFLNGTFEKYALTTSIGGFSNYAELPVQQADYIAVTNGTREYPWRLLVISDDDRTFADCDLVYQLSKPNVLTDTDWIKPGKVAWDWWHDYAVEGQPFKGGVNTETYLYHIDFASKYGLEYILIDWLWTDKYDLTLFNPDVDLRKITKYASSKNVSVIVWCPGHTLHRQLDKALDLFAGYGIAGVKADFFGREDQTGIRMYEDIAQATAKRKMLIDFHGAAKPTGLSRTYPNVINYEAVAGNEWNKLNTDKVTVNHKVMLPFTRGFQGPMDYTPGGMRNLQSGHTLRMTMPEVHGTRSNEMALFVIYNEPLKMLCDAPSVYEREPEITRFISKIPTTWDDTRILQAEFGTYIVSARKTGNNWYVAAITGDQPKTVKLDFCFLSPGKYKAKILKDGPNAARIGTDYVWDFIEISETSMLEIPMVSGGGFVIFIEKM